MKEEFAAQIERSHGIEIKVPAKIMLSGEYAVLYGEKSLSCTLARYMRVKAFARTDQNCSFHSDLWNKTFLWNIKETPPFQEKNPALAQLFEELQIEKSNGFHIEVLSGWQVTDGLGSSSALLLGLAFAVTALFACPEWTTGQKLTPIHWNLARKVYILQKKWQNFASGYDIVTQLVGGLLSFSYTENQWPKECQAIPFSQEKINKFVHIFVGGPGAQTKRVGADTIHALKKNKLIGPLISTNKKSQRLLSEALESSNTIAGPAFYKAIRSHREIFSGMNSFPRTLFEKLGKIAGFDETFSCKTTGAGGQDAMLVFGDTDSLQSVQTLFKEQGWQQVTEHYPANGISWRRITI